MKTQISDLDRLIALVAMLRSPLGCPWDRRQTHRSLIRFLREESRELEAALRHGRWHEMEDELGDLLLQVLLHSQIASEKGLFDIQAVAKSQYLKLVRRHPHVFADERLTSAKAVLANWGNIKKKERILRRKDVRQKSCFYSKKS